jgi:hypothetical protein
MRTNGTGECTLSLWLLIPRDVWVSDKGPVIAGGGATTKGFGVPGCIDSSMVNGQGRLLLMTFRTWKDR